MATDHKTYELVVQPRDVIGKASKRLRKEQIVPGIIYGFGVDPTPVAIDQKQMERVYLHAGSNALVDVKIGEGQQPRKVFIHNVQRNPVTHTLTHVDFMAVNLKEEITTTVALVVVGESPAVARGEGIVVQTLDHLQVRVLPSDVPPLIEVDISGLEEVDAGIHIAQLEVPSNVTVLTPEDELVVKISAVRAEPEEEAAAEEAEQIAEGAEGAAGEESSAKAGDSDEGES